MKRAEFLRTLLAEEMLRQLRSQPFEAAGQIWTISAAVIEASPTLDGISSAEEPSAWA